MAVQSEKIEKRSAETYAKSSRKIAKMMRNYENPEAGKLIQPSPKHVREQKFPAPKFSILKPGISMGANTRIGVPRDINAPQMKKTIVKSVKKPHPSLVQKVIHEHQKEVDLRIKITQK